MGLQTENKLTSSHNNMKYLGSEFTRMHTMLAQQIEETSMATGDSLFALPSPILACACCCCLTFFC